ncbi:HYR domain-containing protein [Weeksellaceae bacterium TAE3-ERU29]|nr:HYR domain-containing protein [Weeksellaceae bacterium TAE3-ERU29]
MIPPANLSPYLTGLTGISGIILKTNNEIKMKQLYLFLLLTANMAFAQLQPFTIDVTATPETCNRNGGLSWTVNDKTAGSTITYSIYKLPNQSTAIATTDQTQITGLEAGSYKIVATQTKNNNTNNTSETVTIADNTIPVLYNISNIIDEFCGNDGKVTINVTSGTAPYEYQLLAADNTVLTTQTSPTFTGLAAGTYKVRVNDACGIGVVKDVIIKSVTLRNFSYNYANRDRTCERYINLYEGFNGNIEGHTITHKISYTNPNTGALIEKEKTTTITSTTPGYGINNGNSYFFGRIDLDEHFPGQTITYTYTITYDDCGTQKTGTFDALNIGYETEIDGYRRGSRDQCGFSRSMIINLRKVDNHYAFDLTDIQFTTMPSGVTQNDLTAKLGNDGDLYISSTANDLPDGLYEGTLTICNGHTLPFSFNYTKNRIISNPNYALNITSQTNVCGSKVASYQVSPYYSNNVEFIDLPAGSNYKINSNTTGLLFNVPPGVYHARFTDSCTGQQVPVEFTINEYAEHPNDEDVNILPLCSGFNLRLNTNYFDPNTALFVYMLQIYDNALGGWTTPIARNNRVAFDPNNPTTADNHGLYLRENQLEELINKANMIFDGKFRIIRVNRTNVYENYQSGRYNKACFNVIKEFEHYSTITIANINSWLCTDGTYNVGVGVKGVGNYTYQIVQDRNSTDAGNILVDNGTNPLFTNLAPGTYLFRVIDDCGNFSTTEYDITTLGAPQIRTVADCATQELRFVVDGVNYLNFKWYKEGEESTILSTSNELNLGNFTPAKAGTYKLHLTSPITTACVNEVLSVKVSEDPFNTPHAGKNSTHTICGDAPVRLSDYLQEANPGEGVDSYGVWQRVNTANDAGALVGDQWFANLATPGLYEFNYVVEGLCSGQDVATITLDTRDLIAPTVTQCPSDVTAFSTNDINAVATWNTPAFDDNCKVYVTSTHQPGETFPMGNTTVTYTAEDRGGNTANCTFNVIVKRFTCAKKPNTGAPQGNVKVGISNLNRTTQTTEWINSYNDGWIAMESKTKGFVITRADDVNHPETAIENPVEGMIVFDIDENCIKLYDGTKWACVAQGCNDDNASNP